MPVAFTDEELMENYAAGDGAAFAELYRRYELRLFTFLERRLPPGRRDSASDLFQKTWLNVHQAKASFDPAKSLSGWLFKIAVNALRDHVGRASFRLDVADESAGLEVPSGEDLERNLLISEELRSAEHLLAALTATQREVLLMSEWDGLSAREIGQVHDLSEVSVRQHLFRAKRKLKELIKEKEGSL